MLNFELLFDRGVMEEVSLVLAFRVACVLDQILFTFLNKEKSYQEYYVQPPERYL